MAHSPFKFLQVLQAQLLFFSIHVYILRMINSWARFLWLRGDLEDYSSSCFWCLLLVVEIETKICVGFLVGWTGAIPLVGEFMSCPPGGQFHVKECVYSWLCIVWTWMGLYSYLLMGRSVFLPCRLFFLRHSSTGACKLLGMSKVWCWDSNL